MAKICNVKVKEFALGFGPKIFEHKGKETKYVLRLIPLGGFCDMLGEAERKDEEGSFSNASVGKRIAIVIAGATVNIVFGLLVYFSIMAINFNEVSTTVDKILPEYQDNLGQLQVDDKIISLNGKKIHLKSDLNEFLEDLNNENVILEIERNGEKKEIEVKATKNVTKYVGIYFGAQDKLSSEIQYVEENSPAEKAGLKVGDKIVGINGKITEDPYEISKNIAGVEVEFSILRKEKEEKVKVKTEDIEYYVLGIEFKPADGNFANRIYYGFWETVNYVGALGENIITIFTGNVKMNQMMGPIGISSVIAKTDGVFEFVYFLSIISLSLGVSNLLPIPALDGGRLLLLFIELIRRKPLKEETEIKIQMLGFSFIIVLSLYISFNDILRIF